ncbi:uncharacterized protein LOC143580899 [Bidens hawaiensis]|uniref:uncharacterized protein LOC143580899 n=1 Tax=Bidens hawaiensis TaxID=980011 RepID=UPI00404A1418
MVMGSSNLMMGLTLVLVVCLAVVLGLVLVLLAELYCSILLRRRHTATTAAAGDDVTTANPPPPLPNLYTQSILSAPRHFLYPAVAAAGDGGEHGAAAAGDIEKQLSSPENQDLLYISNPVYDGDGNSNNKVAGNTPFETPDSSPSRLETEDFSSGDDGDGGADGGGGEEEVVSRKVASPQITPMKKLPAAGGGSDDGGGDGGDGDSNSNNNNISSSSSSGTPCTSLSW